MMEQIDGEEKVTATVALGRTVQFGNDKIYVGTGADRVEILNPGKHIFNSGEQIELPRLEFDRLHSLGFVKLPGEAESRPANMGHDAHGRVTQPGVAGGGLVK